MTAYAKLLPTIDDLNRPYWEGARVGELRMQRCRGCGALRFPPSRLCAECLSEESAWVVLSGKGTVWSYCVFHRAYFAGFEAELPYNVVLVQLAEGPKLYSNLVGVPNERVRVGMPVRVRFERVTDEVTLVKFEPDPSREGRAS